MANPILVKLPPGALQAEPAALAVEWQHPDGTRGLGSLTDCIDAHPGDQLALVLSAADVQLTSVTLTRKQAKHLQKALPYLLEEQVLGEPEQLWFSVGAAQDSRYPVVICDRAGITLLSRWLEEQGARLTGMAVDAQLLMHRGVPQIVEDGDESLLILDVDQVLAIPAGQIPDTLLALGVDTGDWLRLDDRDELFPALRAGWNDGIELLHSELRPRARSGSAESRLITPEWRNFLALAASVLVVIWVLAWVQAFRYGQLADAQWQEAASLYQTLFPEDRATPRLRAQFESRITQLSTGAGGQGGGFPSLMAPVGEALAAARARGVSPQRIQYDERESVLSLDLQAANYEVLEGVREQLEAAGLAAEIANYRNQNDKVAARMNVRGG